MQLSIVWFNTENYTLLQLILFITGALLWVVNYIVLVRNIVKFKFVEMPAVVLGANFTWELLWSWFFVPDIGYLVVLGYRIWFFLDIFIVWGFYKYGYKQVISQAKDKYKGYFTFSLIAWCALQYFFIKQGFDNAIGAHTAYMSNVIISVSYILMFLRLEDKVSISITTAWTKWWGTGLITVMCFLKWPQDYWMLSLGCACFVIDAYYTYLVWDYKNHQKFEPAYV